MNKVVTLNGHKVLTPIKTEEEYRAWRDSSLSQHIMERIEAGETEAKHLYPQSNYNLWCDGPTPLKGCQRQSNVLAADFDLLAEEWAQEKETRAILNRILVHKDVLMVEDSATKGYHAAFRRTPGLTTEQNLRLLSDQLGVEFDKQAKDDQRVYFTTPCSHLHFLSPELFNCQPADEEPEMNPQTATIREVLETPFTPVPEVEPQTEVHTAESKEAPTYLGLPYDAIIDKWWEMYNDGRQPVTSNRDSLTFELAVNLRNICGFNRELLDQVIPCYDGFPQAQKLKCIDSALSEKRTQMPTRLKAVLKAVRAEHITDTQLVDTLDKIEQDDENYYFERLPKAALPQGVKESIDAVGQNKAMAVLAGICPAIGALATGVRVPIHDKESNLNLVSYICGNPGSGKGSIDEVVYTWMAKLQEEADRFEREEKEWRKRKRTAKANEKQPEEPELPVRMLTFNNTLANLAARLENCQGKHAFSFTPEADSVAQRWKQSISDFSVMIRQAFDGSRYEREARSADAVSVHIPHLLWNAVMCGTPDALYRVVTNTTNGLLSRFLIAHMPDNTFTRLEEHPAQLTDRRADRIKQVANLLPLMKGTVQLPKLEEKSRQWTEAVRLQSIKNDDSVLANCRIRDHVIAYRMTVCLMLCWVCEKLIREYGIYGAEKKLQEEPDCWQSMLKRAQTPAMLDAYEVIADSILDNDLIYFRSRMEQGYRSIATNTKHKSRHSKNDSIYERLADKFSQDDALQESIAFKGSATLNAVQCMLRTWEDHEMIRRTGRQQYEKCG